MKNIEDFNVVIKSERKFWELDFREVFSYKDLIKMQVYRNFVLTYKQTILGPLWILLNPLFTTVVHTFLFGNIAGLSTDGIPQILFYMSGNALWILFSTIVTSTSSTFIDNAPMFSKVYFPRLVMPISIATTSFINFLIQMFMLVFFYAFFVWKNANISVSFYMLIMPLMFLQVIFLSVGCGIIISALTTKYRDLKVAVNFGVQLWMYITPVVYPLSSISGKLKTMMLLNPMSASCEMFRKALFGSGSVSWWAVIYSVTISLLIFIIGVCMFNKVERISIDTV